MFRLAVEVLKMYWIISYQSFSLPKINLEILPLDLSELTDFEVKPANIGSYEGRCGDSRSVLFFPSILWELVELWRAWRYCSSQKWFNLGKLAERTQYIRISTGFGKFALQLCFLRHIFYRISLEKYCRWGNIFKYLIKPEKLPKLCPISLSCVTLWSCLLSLVENYP